MNFGKIVGESFEEYFNNTAVGSHRLADVLPRPRVYYEKHIAKTAPEMPDSPAFAFGRLFHCLALEGEAEVEKRFATRPEGIDRRTKIGKDDWQAFVDASGGKQIVTQEDIDLAWQMLGGIRAKASAVKLLARGQPEVTFRHQLASFAVQVRVDWYFGDDPAGPMLVNLKTVETLEDFDKQYLNYNYFRADAFYRMVVAKVLGVEASVPQCVNLVVEKQPPFECSIRIPDAEALDIGAKEVMERLTVIARCFESGVWQGEPDAPRGISLPTWKVKQAEAAP